MKKHILILLVVSIGAFTLFSSCDKTTDKATTDQTTLTEINTDHLKFFGASYNFYQKAIAGVEDINLIIIRIVLWRKSENCLFRLGICKVIFFPMDKKKSISMIGREIEVPFRIDTDEKNLLLYYAQDVSNFTLEELNLHVDEDIIAEDENDLMQSDYKIQNGVYHYNALLGDFGGYSIPLSKVIY